MKLIFKMLLMDKMLPEISATFKMIPLKDFMINPQERLMEIMNYF